MKKMFLDRNNLFSFDVPVRKRLLTAGAKVGAQRVVRAVKNPFVFEEEQASPAPVAERKPLLLCTSGKSGCLRVYRSKRPTHLHSGLASTPLRGRKEAPALLLPTRSLILYRSRQT